MNSIEKYLHDCLHNNMFDNCAVAIGNPDGEKYRYLIDNKELITDADTLFDMASVTKILSVALPALILADQGRLSFDAKMGDFFECTDEKKNITIKNLLTHTSGMGGGAIEPYAGIPENAIQAILGKPLLMKPDTNVIYSCHGYMVMGKILERICGKALDQILVEYVTKPLNMNHTMYLPIGNNIVNSNDNKKETGLVNDFNARFVGGVSGNAGVFSSIDDMSIFARLLANDCNQLLSKKMFDMAIMNYTDGMGESRGLGFCLVDERYSQAGDLFSMGSYGHCGHTGTSVFVHKCCKQYVVVLTNMTKCVKGTYNIVKEFRKNIHNAIHEYQSSNEMCHFM